MASPRYGPAFFGPPCAVRALPLGRANRPGLAALRHLSPTKQPLPGDAHVPLFVVLRGCAEPALQAVAARPLPWKDKAVREQRPLLEEQDSEGVAPQRPVQASLL